MQFFIQITFLFCFRVETIEAKANDYFKQYDWLIGNHSDELTPWIPVMANLSNSNFFVLPCCSFDFYGKFQRISQKKSQYRDYLDHIFEIGQKCGFYMEEDKLRIPSTKRVCFIGTFKDSMNSDLLQSLKQDFVPREAEEKVKNCTKVPKTVIKTIIEAIVHALLKVKNDENLSWNCGGTLDLSFISGSVLSAELLKELKSECGGLQTLLRNHNNIFIVDKGTVRLRNPAVDHHNLGKKKPNQNAIEKYKKTRPCWFFQNHPQGCPSTDCHWIHEK